MTIVMKIMFDNGAIVVAKNHVRFILNTFGKLYDTILKAVYLLISGLTVFNRLLNFYFL